MDLSQGVAESHEQGLVILEQAEPPQQVECKPGQVREPTEATRAIEVTRARGGGSVGGTSCWRADQLQKNIQEE